MQIKEFTKSGIKFIEVTNDQNFKVQLTDLGASIYGIFINDIPMTLTTKDEKDFLKVSHYHGKTIGRYAGRIKDHQFELNNKIYITEENEPNKTLHSGPSGISTKYFAYEIKEGDDSSTLVIFKYHSPALEAGFPGNMDITVTYNIKKGYELEIRFEAICDEDTLCKLTNHSYFCLGSKNLNGVSLKLNSSSFVETEKGTLIPLKDTSVSEVPSCDFSSLKPILKDIDDERLGLGYDMHFNFNQIITDKPQITLTNDKYQLDICTDFQGTQIYSDNFVRDTKFINNEVETTRRGVAIEPQDSHLWDHILRKNVYYKRFINYKFTVK